MYGVWLGTGDGRVGVWLGHGVEVGKVGTGLDVAGDGVGTKDCRAAESAVAATVGSALSLETGGVAQPAITKDRHPLISVRPKTLDKSIGGRRYWRRSSKI